MYRRVQFGVELISFQSRKERLIGGSPLPPSPGEYCPQIVAIHIVLFELFFKKMIIIGTIARNHYNPLSPKKKQTKETKNRNNNNV